MEIGITADQFIIEWDNKWSGYTQNEEFNKKAKELGLDYKNSVEDNARMAAWIYLNAGGINNWVCSLLN